MTNSDLLNFYENTNIFITGGTGFLGKILIEKLLRCTSVSTIYLLIRSKKGKNTESRLKDTFDDIVFERLRKECPKFINKIIGINGDVCLPDLGISETDRKILIENVNIVFHAAATVKFDENLKLAYNINVIGAKSIITLGKEMKNLKSMIHVSTAYSNCNLYEIEEKIYDFPVHYEKIGEFLKNLTESEADAHTSSILSTWPNTYTFTKAMAESMIKENRGTLPIGILRPSIIISTYKEPVEGWIDNLYGPTGICVAVSSGIMRVLFCSKHLKADLVPVDMCVSSLITAAWDTAEKYKPDRTPEDVPVYNYVSYKENCLTWGEYCMINLNYGNRYPMSKTVWTYLVHLVGNFYLYTLMKILFHLIPAIIIDLISSIFYKNLGLWNMYKKIHKFSDVLGFFSSREWSFSNHNVAKLWNRLNDEERKLFYFDMSSLDWWAYYKLYLLGIRKYLMKDSIESLQAAREKKKIFDILHKILLISIYFLSSIAVWKLVRRIFFNSCTPCPEIL